MAKYKYNKKVLKGLGVGAFLGEVKTRNKMIEAADTKLPQSVYNANLLGSSLHPHYQAVKIAKVIERKDARSFILVPDEEKGTSSLAFFRAGQYISVHMDIDGASVNKPYSICSSPADALGERDTSYMLTVKANDNGFASKYIMENWAEGYSTITSGPLGHFYYERLRDAGNVIALAGGSGITPFYSMAAAIADGIEDFNLTILYGNRNRESILLYDELRAVEERAGGKVKVVHVLSDEQAEGFEYGYLTADLISRYAGSWDYSVFVCGPKAMYRFEEQEIAKLGLPERRIRFELSGEYGDPTTDEAYPAGVSGQVFNVSVLIRGETTNIKCAASETLLHAMEMAGISVPSDCRSGQCGWCHSRLISGDVYVPEKADGRRMADKKFGWIHPCTTYPLSDVSLEVFPLSV